MNYKPLLKWAIGLGVLGAVGAFVYNSYRDDDSYIDDDYRNFNYSAYDNKKRPKEEVRFDKNFNYSNKKRPKEKFRFDKNFNYSNKKRPKEKARFDKNFNYSAYNNKKMTKEKFKKLLVRFPVLRKSTIKRGRDQEVACQMQIASILSNYGWRLKSNDFVWNQYSSIVQLPPKKEVNHKKNLRSFSMFEPDLVFYSKNKILIVETKSERSGLQVQVKRAGLLGKNVIVLGIVDKGDYYNICFSHTYNNASKSNMMTSN